MRIFTDLLFLTFGSKLNLHKGFIMESLKRWLKNLFESMAIAFVHPVKNSLPPNIGTHSYSDKPIKRHKHFRYN